MIGIKNGTRLNKYISDSGLCSRRQADKYIEKGHVFINGKKAKIGDQVLSSDRVMVNGQNIEAKDAEAFIFIAFNKPPGITSTTEANVRENIVDYVNHSERIFPIGRLDKDSQGLIFLTNNGDIVNKILRAGNHHEKEYVVTVNKPVTDTFLNGMMAGVPMLGKTTRKCNIKQISPFVFNITLIQGLNRQIRRMCEYFDYEVTKLERIRIMNINLKGLALGDWRTLEPNEMESIHQLLKNSSTTQETPKPKAKPKKKKMDSWEDNLDLDLSKVGPQKTKLKSHQPHAANSKPNNPHSKKSFHKKSGSKKTEKTVGNRNSNRSKGRS